MNGAVPVAIIEVNVLADILLTLLILPPEPDVVILPAVKSPVT